MTDKTGSSIGKTDDSQSSQSDKNLESQTLNMPAQTDGQKEASSQKLLWKIQEALSNLRTSC